MRTRRVTQTLRPCSRIGPPPTRRPSRWTRRRQWKQCRLSRREWARDLAREEVVAVAAAHPALATLGAVAAPGPALATAVAAAGASGARANALGEGEIRARRSNRQEKQRPLVGWKRGSSFSACTRTIVRLASVKGPQRTMQARPKRRQSCTARTAVAGE